MPHISQKHRGAGAPRSRLSPVSSRGRVRRSPFPPQPINNYWQWLPLVKGHARRIRGGACGALDNSPAIAISAIIGSGGAVSQPDPENHPRGRRAEKRGNNKMMYYVILYELNGKYYVEVIEAPNARAAAELYLDNPAISRVRILSEPMTLEMLKQAAENNWPIRSWAEEQEEVNRCYPMI